MKADIPSLNIIVSLLYLLLAGATMFLLKLASKPLPQLPQTKTQSNQEKPQLVYRRLAMSLIKKYSIVGAMMLSDRKYLVKELLIVSVYGVACLRINKITLWPVALLTFILPTIFFIYEMALKLQRNSQSSKQQVKAVNQVQLEVQHEGIQGKKVTTVDQRENKSRKAKGFRNLYEIVTISIIVFVGVVLDFETMMALDNSTSNSGELNIISVLCIVLLDQLLLRPISGILLIGIIKLLQWRQIVSLHENKLVVLVCEQLLFEQLRMEEQRKACELVENTQAHLKHIEEIVRDLNLCIKPERTSMLQIDFQQIQPYENKQVLSPHQVLNRSLSKPTSSEEFWFTTHQKQMFQADRFKDSEQSILKAYIYNKQNAQNNTQPLHQFKQVKENSCFEELVLTNAHQPLANIQNYKGTLELQNQSGEVRRKKTLDKRKNRRILNLTGNSPYLQYLPNMLKNVKKAAQATGVVTAPKLVEMNFR